MNWRITDQGIVLAGRRLPVTRGQIMMLMVAVNLLFLGLDIYLAHGMNGTIRPYEWIPIVFGPAAGVVLLVAGLISLRQRRLAILLAFAVLAVSIVVGIAGAYFHLVRALPPGGAPQLSLTLVFFVYGPPLVGPLTFSLVGVLGVIAAVVEDPPGSGRMVVPGLFSWRVPFSKSQQYYIWISLGILATLLSSVLDHGRFNFENVWVWVPTIVGVFAAVAAMVMGMLKNPSRSDQITFFVAMIGLIVVAVIGFLFHIQTDLARANAIVPERFLRGAPFLAPLLFADMAGLGLVAMLPDERPPAESRPAEDA
jgi:preprotein translocase subunit Sss1